MRRPLLVPPLALLLATLPVAARAADPPPPASAADPFAPPPERKEPSVEDQEAAVFGSPTDPAPSTPPPPPAAAPARRPAPAARARRVAQASGDERPQSGDVAAPSGGVALELSTTGFASGALAGGLFLGGRTATGVIIGGFFDYGLTSLNVTTTGTSSTESAQLVRVGAGARYTFVQSADRMVDLYGAGDVSFEYRSAEIPLVGGPMPTESVSAAGFSLAAGPGLRLWVHERLALGYAARLRMTYLSGEGGVFAAPATASTIDASATAIGFDGTFQILGVF
jgi:hypothetical protein